MSQISVISKLTGVETTTEGTQITLDHSSIVKLNVDRADISGYSRSGNDLVITLNSGEVITLKNFYVTDAQGVSQLVLEESDGALWWIEDPTGAATYESIASTDALLAASGSDAGGAAELPHHVQIGHAVEHLQKVREHIRQGKDRDGLEDIAACEVVFHGRGFLAGFVYVPV